jgi:hypothetical protein
MVGSAQSRPRWRRLIPRMSVRSLMTLVLILGAGLGWLVGSARIQREAVAAIRRAGGTVRYDWEAANGGTVTAMGGMVIPVKNTKPPWPRWMVDRLGIDYFGNVAEVDLFGRGSDAEVAHIGWLSRLEKLTLSQSAVTDAGLVHLRGMSRLKWLYLGGTVIGDAGLAHLEGLDLRGLGLDATLVGDAGLSKLEGMTDLQQLVLSSTRISDSGLVHLKRMTGLEILSLDHTGVTDAGTPFLGRLTRLKFLQLEGTRVSTAGLVHLKGLTGLGELRVNREHVTDVDVADLRKEWSRTIISVE